MNSTPMIVGIIVSVVIVLVIIGTIAYLASKKKKQSKDTTVIVPDVTTPVEPGDDVIIVPKEPDLPVIILPDVPAIPIIPEMPEVPIIPEMSEIISGQFENRFDQLGRFTINNRNNVITLTTVDPIDIQLTRAHSIFENQDTLEYFQGKEIISVYSTDDTRIILDKEGNIVVISENPSKLVIPADIELFRYNYTQNTVGQEPRNVQLNHINPVWRDTFN